MSDVTLRYIPHLLILCLFAVHGSADDTGTQNAPAGQESSEQIEFRFDGVWKPKGAMLGGVLLPPPALNAITLKIDKNTYEVSIEGEELSDIAATEQSSTPVIDFDDEEKRLHVTDPFFAFYLRWGSLDG